MFACSSFARVVLRYVVRQPHSSPLPLLRAAYGVHQGDLSSRGLAENLCILLFSLQAGANRSAERGGCVAGSSTASESWLRESAQGDKWSLSLTAGKIGPRNQERA